MGATSLPEHFPDGTHYIIEGRPDKAGKMQIVSRQLILPNGKQIDLGAKNSGAKNSAAKSFERPRTAARIKRKGRSSR